MTKGPWPLASFGGAWEFVADGDGTRVLVRYQFKIRPRWLAWAVEPMARAWFSREMPRYAWRLPWHYGRFTFTCEQDA